MGDFNQLALEAVWPASLQRLCFGNVLKQPIVRTGWPRFLRQLSFGDHLNQPIAELL